MGSRVTKRILDVTHEEAADLFARFDVVRLQYFPPPSFHYWEWTLRGGLRICLRLEQAGPRWFLEAPRGGSDAER